jgi:hypothetical protein
MSDERRAEIEAIARALYEQGFGFNIDADDTARESMFSVARVVLDRLRDARGDDEAANAAERQRERVRVANLDYGQLAAEVKKLRADVTRWEERFDRWQDWRFYEAAPQGEDHEKCGHGACVRPKGHTGSHSVHLEGTPFSVPQNEGHEAEVWFVQKRHFHPDRPGTPMNDWVRVSPSRDGTVAVEDYLAQKEATMTLRRLGDAMARAILDLRMHEGRAAWDAAEIARDKWLAEFSPASTGDREENDERRP